MRRLAIIILFLMPACVQGQQKKPNSKRATTVDSINTPPRMDGNTGRYDTVKHPRINHRQREKTKGTEYDYKLGTDTIGIRKK